MGTEGTRAYQQREGHACHASPTEGSGRINPQVHDRNAPINSTGHQDIIGWHHHDSGRDGHDKAEPQTWSLHDASGAQRAVK